MENTSKKHSWKRTEDKWRKVCFLANICFLLGGAVNLAEAQNVLTPSVKVNVLKANVTFKQVLSDLEKQSGYYFVYSSAINVNQLVNVTVKEMPLKQALDKLCNAAGLTYEFSDKYITC